MCVQEKINFLVCHKKTKVELSQKFQVISPQPQKGHKIKNCKTFTGVAKTGTLLPSGKKFNTPSHPIAMGLYPVVAPWQGLGAYPPFCQDQSFKSSEFGEKILELG